MNLAALLVALVGALAASCSALAQAPATGGPSPEPGFWRAAVASPGGELPFTLEITAPATDDRPAGVAVFIRNGPESAEIPVVRWDGADLLMSIDYFDAHLRARVAPDGRSMRGEYSRRRAAEWVRMPFEASYAGQEPPARFGLIDRGGAEAAGEDFAGRWALTWGKDAEPAIALLRDAGPTAHGARRVEGTVLTPAGDYRYIEGEYSAGRLMLSKFDGVHVFLFRAQRDQAGGFEGEFWSGAAHHDTFRLARDDAAALPDPFTRAVLRQPRPDFASLRVTTLEGEPATLADPALGAGARARVLYVMGSWCPNCKDATALLNELVAAFGPAGLAVTGLAFEITGDPERDLRQARVYSERWTPAFPMVLAGVSGERSAQTFPVLERIRAYPTFLFVDARGEVVATYTGFAGPATGEAHERLRRDFDRVLRRLLAE